jgi:hypothetical protein
MTTTIYSTKAFEGAQGSYKRLYSAENCSVHQTVTHESVYGWEGTESIEVESTATPAVFWERHDNINSRAKSLHVFHENQLWTYKLSTALVDKGKEIWYWLLNGEEYAGDIPQVVTKIAIDLIK